MTTTDTTEEKTMPTKTTADTRTVTELEQAVLDGDNTITAEQLGAARLRQQHQALQREAQLRLQQAEARAARDRDLQRLRDDILGRADGGDEMRQAGAAAVAALERLYSLGQDRERQLDELASRAGALGVVPMGLDDTVRDESGLGWRKEHQTVGPARIRVDDVLLSAASPTKLVARAVFEAFTHLGQRVDGFTLANPGPCIDEQIAAQVREIVPQPTRRVRVTKRWGPRQPGDIVEVPITDARWALDKGFAVPAIEAG
jgi:hypothetical protein